MAESMAASPWLPPLNSRYESETDVTIKQTVPGSKKRPLNGPAFFIKFKATVDFYEPDNDDDKEPSLDEFRGLKVTGDFQIPFDDLSTEGIEKEIHNHSSLKFTRGDIDFTQRHLNEMYNNSCEISGSAELYENILQFLCLTTEMTENAEANSIEVELSIYKAITVPRAELQQWHEWYAEKKRNNPHFEDEFQMAIRRPRTDEEEARARVPDIEEEDLLELEEVALGDLGTEKTCCICYEDFSPESKRSKLGCDHVFDHECIEKWLRHSNVCPLCRFNE